MGAIGDARGAQLALENGAAALQVYSALIFKGPDLIREIHEGLASTRQPTLGH